MKPGLIYSRKYLHKMGLDCYLSSWCKDQMRLVKNFPSPKLAEKSVTVKYFLTIK